MSLFQKLRSVSRQEFKSALEELSSVPKDEAIGLLEQLANDLSGVLRSRAVDGLVIISPDRAEALSIEQLNDPEPGVRVNAVHALWQLHSMTSAAMIARVLATDADEITRSWAAFSLGDLGDATVVPILVTAADQDIGVDHEGRPIRDIALGAIKMIGSRLADRSNLST